MLLYLISIVFTVLVGTCAPSPAYAQVPYAIDAPELLVSLPKELNEISGLTLDGNDLLAIEDEDGIIFRLSVADGSIKERIPFWEEGDYEGIALVGKEIWITKSNGRLYQVIHPGSEQQEVKEYNTWLNGDNDVEGLAYDPAENRLLLACKDDPKGNGLDKENRYIFAFDLASKKLSDEAAFSIPREDDFAPSALAIHPLTRQLFLTSSVGKQLLVATSEGAIETIQKVDEKWFPQPEGLCFAADGTLYISTEAKDGEPARIYRLPLAP